MMRLRGELEDDHWLTGGVPTDRTIFTYGSTNKVLGMLQSRTLRLNPYSGMNDPRERKKWLPTITLGPGGIGPASLSTADAAEMECDRLLRRGGRLACFTEDRDPADGAGSGSYFHRGWARARMWDQYADSHAGAVLVFDQVELVEGVDNGRPGGNGDLFAAGEVQYVDGELEIDLNMEDVASLGLEAALEQVQVARHAASSLYFTKNLDWASEREYRIVVVRWNVPDDQRDEPIVIDFKDSLKAVILGEEFKLTKATRYLMQEHPQAELLRCEWVRGAPHLLVA